MDITLTFTDEAVIEISDSILIPMGYQDEIPDKTQVPIDLTILVPNPVSRIDVIRNFLIRNINQTVARKRSANEIQVVEADELVT